MSDSEDLTAKRGAPKSIDEILYKSKEGLALQNVKKAPELNFKAELSKTNSYLEAREEIQTQHNNYLADRIQIAEREERHEARDRFSKHFLQTRLATSGIPTVNTIHDVIERRRNQESEDDALEDEIWRKINIGLSSGTVDFHNMKFDHIPSQLYSTMILQLIHRIHGISFSSNEFRHLPGSFFSIVNGIKALNFRENHLAALPEEMHDLETLQTLRLDSNDLCKLPVVLPLTLKEVSIQDNMIKSLPWLNSLVNLVELNLSGNQLRVLPNAMHRLIRLRKLKLNSNLLITLAILPAVILKKTAPDPAEVGEAEDWIQQEDPDTKTLVYYNKVTRAITRKTPKALVKNSKVDVPSLSLDFLKSGGTALKAKDEEDEKRNDNDDNNITAEEKYPGGWEVIPKGANVEFFNRRTKERHSRVPPALEKMGFLEDLQSLSLAGNHLFRLPDSLCELKRLKTLDLDHNRLTTLPKDIGSLKSLRVLKLSSNSILALPDSITELGELVELNLRLNRLTTLPKTLGNLSKVQVIDLTCNLLVAIPTSTINLKALKELKLQNNPSIQLPTQRSIAAGLKAILWECHNQLKVERRGQPPEAKHLAVGIASEVITTNLNIKDEFSRRIENARKCKTLNYHWKDLKCEEIPFQMYQLRKLRELRLIGHKFDRVPIEFKIFKNLQILNLRKNKITEVGESCFPVDSLLRELHLENNRITEISETISRLKHLTLLRLTNNCLKELPKGIGDLKKLEEVHIDHNKLLKLPDEFAHASNVRLLNLSYNDIRELDNVNFSLMTCLTIFQINCNVLTDLPSTLQVPQILELSVSANRFTKLPPVIVKMKFMKKLWMRSNSIFFLPKEFGELTLLSTVELDGNPMRCPPPDVITEGVVPITQYLTKQQERLREVSRVLTIADIAFEPKNFGPITKNLVTNPSPYLSNEDIKALETDIDHYVNAEFYIRDDTAVDIVSRYLVLEYEKGQIQRRKVLEDFVKFCELIRDKRWLDKVDFAYDQERPWGEDGAMEDCFVITPESIFEDTDDIPCIIKVVNERVRRGFKEEAFTHKPEAIEDALKHYIGPYGPVGHVNVDKAPLNCGCEDMIRKRKMHQPCYKTAWTVLQTLVTEEEKNRKIEEENAISIALEKLKHELEKFLETEDGEKRLLREVRRIRNEITLRRKEIRKEKPRNKKRIKELTLDLKGTVAKYKLAKAKRKSQWTSGEEKEANAAIQDAKEALKNLKQLQVKNAAEFIELGNRAQQEITAFKPEVAELLLVEAGEETRVKLLNRYRYTAVKLHLRRHWDGRNGEVFEEYKSNLLHLDYEPKLFRSNSVLSDVSYEEESESEEASEIEVSSVSSGDLSDLESSEEMEDNSEEDTDL